MSTTFVVGLFGKDIMSTFGFGHVSLTAFSMLSRRLVSIVNGTL